MCGNTPKPLDRIQALYWVMLWTVVFFLSIAAAQAGQVTLAWNASSGPVAGYHVYYSQQSGSYPATPQKITADTTAMVSDLSDGATYYFVVRAHDGNGTVSGPSNEVSTTLAAVAPAPVANFSANKTSGTAPVTIQFTDGSTNATAWSWSFGDGTSSTAQSPSTTYSSAGTYTVSLTVTGSGGSDTITRTNYITVTEPAPVASFTASPKSGDAPLTVTLTDTSSGSITKRTWDFGDGTSQTVETAQTFMKTYSTSNDYTVTLMVTGSGGSHTATQVISATASAPVADFNASPTSGTAPLVVNFTDLSIGEITDWSWNFGDGTTSTARHPAAHTYQTEGTFTVSLTVTGPGGTSSPKTVTITAESTATDPLPEPWQNRDIGSVGMVGSAGYVNENYTLEGSGADIGGSADAFHFAYQPLAGDGSIVARVIDLTNTDSSAKAGVMIRETLDANARHALVAITPAEGVAFQRRTATGGSSESTTGNIVAAPYWVKLTRAGDTFTAYQSTDGHTWTEIGKAVTLGMEAEEVYVGLAHTSHNNSVLGAATLDQVNVVSTGASDTSPAPSPEPKLSAIGYKVRGLQKAELIWSNNATANVDVYRDNVPVATTPNTGTFTDHIDRRGSGVYVYKICEAGTNSCSNESTVAF